MLLQLTFEMIRYFQVLARVILALCGGYFAASAILALLCRFLVVSGMNRSETVLLGEMMVFIVYLLLILWAFSAPKILPVCALLIMFVIIGHGATILLGKA